MTLAEQHTSSVTNTARMILGIVPSQIEVHSEDSKTIKYLVQRAFGWQLATVVFSKQSLFKLANDPNRDVKIEYLRRDLLESAAYRKEYTYPRSLASGG